MELLTATTHAPTAAGLEVAKGITDFGMLAVTAGLFLVLTAMLWVACFRWFKSIIDKIVADWAALMTEVLAETRKQNELLTDLAEDAQKDNLLRTKNISGAFFDLAVERVRVLIDKVRRENHIDDREATRAKIHTLLQNMHDDRNSRLDAFEYRGRPLSDYTNEAWVAWVEEVVTREVYSPTPNPDREHTNITAVYERIRIDFYKRLIND